MKSDNSKYGAAWSREELILALYLYCQIPFSKTSANNPEVQQLAALIGRTPSSVARKLGNFGAFDPALARRGIRGLTHYSYMDKEIWEEFSENWENLVNTSKNLVGNLGATMSDLLVTKEDDVTPRDFAGRGTSKAQMTLVRLCQSFFRRTVLSSYQNSCCVCRLDLPTLLVASHIVPWATNKEQRANPHNGLCLCSLHDRAFDRGLISVDRSYQILLSKDILKRKTKVCESAFLQFRNKKISLPTKFYPEGTFLLWHADNIFRG